MKIRAEVMVLAMQIEERFQEYEASLKSFEKSFGSKYTKPWLGKVDVSFRTIHKDSAKIFGKTYDQDVTHSETIWRSK